MWIGYATRLGDAWIEWEGDALLRLGLPNGAKPVGAAESDPPAWVSDLASGLVAYFDGVAGLPLLPSAVRVPCSTPFREQVHGIVRSIPYGETMTYREVADRAGRPGAARAVGAAMADNPVAPLVPCHRVVGSDGGLRGYAGGIDMKRQLIDMEAGNA